jgi:MscS family membrane protein
LLETPTLPWHLDVLLVGLLSGLVSWLLLDQVGRRCPRGSTARGLLLTSRLSIALTCVLVGLSGWLATLLDGRLLELPRNGEEVRELVVAFGIAWTLLRWKRGLQCHRDTMAERLLPGLTTKDQHFLIDVLEKTIATGVTLILVLAVMRLLGVSAAVLITAGGFGAAAIGFGAQGIVSNSLSGLSLYINRPFVVGDFIEIPSESLSGTVEHISWFYTQLRSLERQHVYVPNTIFTSKPVVNIAEIDNRRLWIEFGVSYSDRPQIPAIVAELEQHLQQHPQVDRSKPLAVNFVGYGDSSLNLRLLCHSDCGDVLAAWALQQQLLLAIGDTVERHGASMPFPTRTLIPAPGGPDPL